MRAIFATALIMGLVGGCVARAENEEIERDTKALVGQYRQVLDNIALFRAHPDTLPRHIFLRRGSVGVEASAGVGAEEFPVSFEESRSTRWEVVALNDPDDLARVRLLYQWVVGRLSFDALRAKWDAHEAATGRPRVALPVGRETPVDWYCEEPSKAAVKAHWGAFHGKRVWVKDIGGAADFAIAVLRAAPNSRREGGGRSAGE
jgi:hypothetical protein